MQPQADRHSNATSECYVKRSSAESTCSPIRIESCQYCFVVPSPRSFLFIVITSLLHENGLVIQVINKFTAFYKTPIFANMPKVPATGSYSESDEFNPCHYLLPFFDPRSFNSPAYAHVICSRRHLSTSFSSAVGASLCSSLGNIYMYISTIAEIKLYPYNIISNRAWKDKLINEQ